MNGMPDATSRGRRVKMGVIIPTVNTVTEPEFNAMRPEGVTVHFTRMPIHFHPEEDDFKGLMEDLEIRLNEFALFAADIVAYKLYGRVHGLPPGDASQQTRIGQRIPWRRHCRLRHPGTKSTGSRQYFTGNSLSGCHQPA